jgi:type II secretory ATPase GspE/PulE/Tfp pilus assembly ATPase PilB-like protein
MENESAVGIIESILRQAHALKASDIHLDPTYTGLHLRFRVHGTLTTPYPLPSTLQTEIVARLKILADLRIDEHALPQDGRFKFILTETAYLDVRVSLSPTYHGENAVLRIFSSERTFTSLTSLGFTEIQQDILKEHLKHLHGMILITGPTGSGKTSTLYNLLQLRNEPGTSLITIEDPIECSLPGIVQIPVHTRTGLTFAKGLRSILRQDPNILGIGEIRDDETAALAINAALTGHLVLSTLHTIDAPTALPRLLDMHIEPYLIASTVQLIISQRLLTTLCPECREALSPNTYVSTGCISCNGTGTIGRIGVFELMPLSPAIREAVARRAPAHEIRALALSEGMISLYEGARAYGAEGRISQEVVDTLTPR